VHSSWNELRAELGADRARPAYESARIAFELGAEVRALREERGWSQAELAKRAGITKSALARFEAGGYSIRSDTVSDRIRFDWRREMAGADLLERIRRAAGLSQDELARRAGTSRTAVSAYEHGRKSPSLDTVDRLVTSAGYELDARPHITFVKVPDSRGWDVVVPSQLPQLPPRQALATVELPLTLNWSRPGRVYRLSERGDRARVYEIVLREGNEDDVLRYIDGNLLVDIWDELVLPRIIRAAWSPLIEESLGVQGAA
jgi:transcriptional regulator with XRE-family HTH domain